MQREIEYLEKYLHMANDNIEFIKQNNEVEYNTTPEEMIGGLKLLTSVYSNIIQLINEDSTGKLSKNYNIDEMIYHIDTDLQTAVEAFESMSSMSQEMMDFLSIDTTFNDNIDILSNILVYLTDIKNDRWSD